MKRRSLTALALALVILTFISSCSPIAAPVTDGGVVAAPTATRNADESVPALRELTIAPIPDDLPQYDRAEWRHWIDADRDCQDTCAEILIEESLVPVTFRDGRECTVDAGQWMDPYTGGAIAEASELDIDHLVPLANAHRSVAWAWTPEQRQEYANDRSTPEHLIAVSAPANRAKGDAGPEEWRPPNTAYWCEYAVQWTEVKWTWNLTATED